MKTFLKLALLGSAVLLASCGDTPEEKAMKDAKAASVEAERVLADMLVKQEAEKVLRVCAPDNVLHDTSSYSNDVADPNLEQADWFAANGARKGVMTTASGLQYSVNKSGNPEAPMPIPTQTVRVHYHGQFMNGEKFDSSYDREEDIEFPLNRVIAGWTEGVGLMRPCDAWTLYIPSDLAYGPNGRGGIPPATPLMFHVQLIEISD